MPDWRYNDLNVLLPHQIEDKAQGLRSFDRRKASVAISDQVLGVLADMLPNHEGGERLIDCLERFSHKKRFGRQLLS